jgi:ABC-type hemin transport system ATPase subunit
MQIADLALQRNKYKHLTDDEWRWFLQQEEGRQRTADKLPTFAAIPDWWYPVRLSCEQCSSELTARYKASLLSTFNFHLSFFNAHSDGEKQRILIAKALAQQTPIILLDEPTAHLDLPHRILILRLLRQLAHEQGKTILISTHELDLALALSDRIMLMTPGRGIVLDTPEALKKADAFTPAFGMDIFNYSL